MRRTCFAVMVLLLAGCEPVTRAFTIAADTNASTARVAANQAAVGAMDTASMVYSMEMLARAGENLSAAAHGRPPRWVGPPENRPSTLPWVPVGGASPVNPAVQP